MDLREKYFLFGMIYRRGPHGAVRADIYILIRVGVLVLSESCP